MGNLPPPPNGRGHGNPHTGRHPRSPQINLPVTMSVRLVRGRFSFHVQSMSQQVHSFFLAWGNGGLGMEWELKLDG